MATGASTADLAILLVDATKGLLTQTRRHAVIVSLLGIRDVVLAVNKMDLVGFDEEPFRAIAAEFGAFAAKLSIERVTAIPISARAGDNVSMPQRSGRRTIPARCCSSTSRRWCRNASRPNGPFRMPVQWVCRPNAEFRGFAGPILSGRAALGDEVVGRRVGPHEPYRSHPRRRRMSGTPSLPGSRRC